MNKYTVALNKRAFDYNLNKYVSLSILLLYDSLKSGEPPKKTRVRRKNQRGTTLAIKQVLCAPIKFKLL